MTGTVSGFRHTGVSVKNMDASLAFYRLLGLEVVSDRVSDDGGRLIGASEERVRICVLGIPGSDAQIELLEYRGGTPIAVKAVDFGVGHASFWVTDIERLYERLVAERVHVYTGPIDPPSGRKKFYAADPDGFLIELTEAPTRA